MPTMGHEYIIYNLRNADHFFVLLAVLHISAWRYISNLYLILYSNHQVWVVHRPTIHVDLASQPNTSPHPEC
jgi:hypothetical protein